MVLSGIHKALILQELDSRLNTSGMTFWTFAKDTNSQDILLFNLTQAIQNCIDIAVHILSDEGWGLPGTQSEIFDILADKGLISKDFAGRLISMVGFRNRVVHEYEKPDLEIVYKVWQERLRDAEEFAFAVVERFG